jgi:hypothetical protein
MKMPASFMWLTALPALVPGASLHGEVVFDTLNSPFYYPSSEYYNFGGTLTLAGEARLLTTVVFGCNYANLVGGDDFLSPSLTDTNGQTFFRSRPLLLAGTGNGAIRLELGDLHHPENPVPLSGPVPDTFSWSLNYSGTSHEPPWGPDEELFFVPTVGAIAVGSGDPCGYWYPYPEPGLPYYLPVLIEAVVPEPGSLGLAMVGLLGLWGARRRDEGRGGLKAEAQGQWLEDGRWRSEDGPNTQR